MNIIHLIWIIPLGIICGTMLVRLLSWFAIGRSINLLENPNFDSDIYEDGPTGASPGGVSYTQGGQEDWEV